MNIGINKISGKILVFQDKKYNGYDIPEYISKYEDKLPLEIFPGIMISLQKDKGLKKFVNILRNVESERVQFDIINKRDRFEIIDDINYSISQEKIQKTSMEEINPKEISYPNNLGGGKCKGCPVIVFFSGLEQSGPFKIITQSEIVEQTKNMPYFINECKKSGCYYTYRKIVEQGYKELEKRDMIHIEERDGIYIPQEGKHRICAMKRFDYDHNVKMVITHIKNSNKGDIYINKRLNSLPTVEEIDRYYKCFKNYGIDRDKVLEYLSDESKELCLLIIENNKLG